MATSRQKNLFGAEDLPDEEMSWERAAREDRQAVEVVVNRPLQNTFHYLVPDDLRGKVKVGQRVRVPFGKGNRATIAYCVGVGPPPETSRKLKSVDSILDRQPLLSLDMLELTRWIAERYLCGWGQVLDSVIPAGVKNRAGTRLVTVYRVASDLREKIAEIKLSDKQAAVVKVLTAAARPLPMNELTEAAGCGDSPVKTLLKKGLILSAKVRTENFVADFGPAEKEQEIILNDDQRTVLETILATVRAREHKTLLLHGVTGSGKTEVYIQAICEIVGYGRQAIVLVPEISLTPQTIRRFRSRFPSVAVLHSHLSDAERHWHWQQIAQGKVQVVVGARSAIFAPTPHLGLIVIDEEHETSFKQETAPRYHAREVARKRAELENVPLILGSATPTLESWLRVKNQQDELLSLPNRVAKLPMPPVTVVDIRNDPHCSKGAAIGRALRTAIDQAIKDDGQVILFLNLRGYSPTVWCRSCGTGVKCPNCDITLTLHKDRKVVLCHFCDFETDPPATCPACGQPGIRYFGAGTQRLEEEVRARFPGVKCLRMDSDSMRKPGSHDKALEAFRHGEVKILLGTQMIAKGLDFPNVTLVGVIDADTVLHQPDPRASERTFQLIAQVAGRAGRGEKGGRVLVQSANPTDPAIMFAARHDYIGFAEHEMRNRQEVNSPPFVHLARVILRGENEEAVKADANEMAKLLEKSAEETKADVRILGPAPALIAVLKKNYRYHFQLAAESVEQIHELWRGMSEKLPHTNGIEYQVDVDPLNMR